MRALGLDVGQKNIGVALSDPEGKLAYSRGTIRRTKLGRDLEEIARIVAEEEVELVVIGLPRSLSGALGAQAESVQRFGDALKRRLDVPVTYWDERLTTVAAQREMREAGVPPRVRRQTIDAVAAALILQNYLDYLRGRQQREGSEG